MPVTNQPFLPQLLPGAHSLPPSIPPQPCWNPGCPAGCSGRADLGQNTPGERELEGSLHPDNFPDVVKGPGEGLQSWRKAVLKKYPAAKREKWTNWGDPCTGSVPGVVFHCASPKR